MDWFDRIRSETDALLRATELPRDLLRHFLLGNELTIGSRVLVVGCQVRSLVKYLHWLGLNPLGLIESPEEVMACRREMPKIEFHFGRFDESITIPQHSLDAVFVHDCSPWNDSLFSPVALRSTAHLAACVRPSGLLSVVTKSTGQDMVTDEVTNHIHRAECFESQWSEFPGKISSKLFSTKSSVSNVIHRWIGNSSPDHAVLTSLITPQEPLSRREWLNYAEQANVSSTRKCCGHVEEAPASVPIRRAA